MRLFSVQAKAPGLLDLLSQSERRISLPNEYIRKFIPFFSVAEI